MGRASGISLTFGPGQAEVGVLRRPARCSGAHGGARRSALGLSGGPEGRPRPPAPGGASCPLSHRITPACVGACQPRHPRHAARTCYGQRAGWERAFSGASRATSADQGQPTHAVPEPVCIMGEQAQAKGWQTGPPPHPTWLHASCGGPGGREGGALGGRSRRKPRRAAGGFAPLCLRPLGQGRGHPHSACALGDGSSPRLRLGHAGS